MTKALEKYPDLRALRVAVRKMYIKNSKDDSLDEMLAELVENKKDFDEGAGSPRRGFFVIGQSGSGKSWSIRRALASNPDLQPRVNEYGELLPQYLSLKVGNKAASINLVSDLLKAMGLPHDGKEKKMTDELMNQFKQRGIWLLHLDELQHTVRSNTTKAFEAIQDLLKGMLDNEEWPLHMVLSGVDRIKQIQLELQIDRRSECLTFYPMTSPANNDRIQELMTKIAVEACDLELDDKLKTEEFYERLCMAKNGAWGTMIETIQSVSFAALKRGRKKLKITDFAQDYEATKGCPVSENLFVAPNFRDIDC
ncbi:ATP-binding protein [Rhizobium sp. 16-449-1b]|uniref:ATP-binding protein n=1 Tax=Rhizobium sp. 16-449-1b TaxID=2819989 RepID=UPI001ADB582E|nr:ATP-binding protein [Rhizobium sp. 16-449-1b]MBO9198130.1 ATP-binding protein [Rhizobium sp. 16-449-1b]